MTARRWTEAEDALIRAAYAHGLVPHGFLTALAEKLGRSRMAVALYASKNGLASPKTPHIPPSSLKNQAKYTPEERRRVMSDRAKAQWATQGHPRGALGLKHSLDAKSKMSAASKRAWEDPASRLNSDAERQRRSDQGLQRALGGGLPAGEQSYSRAAGGRRPDLDNRYFRSSWEANYARFLNLLVARGEIASWEYEVKTFTFDAIKRGTRAYTPDFRVVYPDGHHEWHEVKGWMDQKSKTKLKRMAKYYPSETVCVIEEEWFRAAQRSGLAGAIPGWERRK